MNYLALCPLFSYRKRRGRTSLPGSRARFLRSPQASEEAGADPLRALPLAAARFRESDPLPRFPQSPRRGAVRRTRTGVRLGRARGRQLRVRRGSALARVAARGVPGGGWRPRRSPRGSAALRGPGLGPRAWPGRAGRGRLTRLWGGRGAGPKRAPGGEAGPGGSSSPGTRDDLGRVARAPGPSEWADLRFCGSMAGTSRRSGPFARHLAEGGRRRRGLLRARPG